MNHDLTGGEFSLRSCELLVNPGHTTRPGGTDEGLVVAPIPQT